MISDIIKSTEQRMEKCNESFKAQIKKIHIGRITPNILNNIKIKDHRKENYTPLPYLASMITENARTLILTVFDITMVKNIEKNIRNLNFDLHTSSNGNIIRVSSPILTEERRQQLIKLVYKESEKSKVSIRNIRRSVNDQIKKFVKNKSINEEKEHYLLHNIQTLTDTWIKKINDIVKKKEIELKIF